MWRKGWVPAGTTEATPLCNACGLLCAPRPLRVPAHAPRSSFRSLFQTTRSSLRSSFSKTRFATTTLARSRVLTSSRSRRYKRGWFCSWCATVYRKREEDDAPRALGPEAAAQLWVGCDRCDRWSHLSCELANDPASLGKGRKVTFEAGGSHIGDDRTTSDQACQATQATQTAQTTRRVYHCPSCREADGRTRDAVERLSRLSDRDPSWASSPLSRAAGATLAATGVVAHVRPYLRERDRSGNRLRGVEATRESRKRGRGGDAATPRAAVRDAPRATRAKKKPRPAPKRNPPKPNPRSAPKPAAVAHAEERLERDDSIAALILGSKFASAEIAPRGVPKAARTFRGRPRASRAGAAAADALEAADAEPKTEAATRGPAETPAEARLPRAASLDARADDADAKADVKDTAASHEDASPTVSPAEPTVAAVPAIDAAPEKKAHSPAPAAPPYPPLRGGAGSPRGLRLLRPSARGPPPSSAREERLVPPAPRAAAAPSGPNADTLRAVNAFVAGGVRPGGSMLVRLLADALWSLPSRSASTPSAPGDTGGDARRALPEAQAAPPPSRDAREIRARLPARASSSALAAGSNASGSAKPADANADANAVGGAFVAAAKGKERREAATFPTFPFPPPSRGPDSVARWRDEEDVLLDDADADPWGLGCEQEWSDAMDWGDSV